LLRLENDMTGIQWFLFVILPLGMAIVAVVVGESFRAHYMEPSIRTPVVRSFRFNLTAGNWPRPAKIFIVALFAVSVLSWAPKILEVSAYIALHVMELIDMSGKAGDGWRRILP
jgi:hypothetical protein